MPPPLLCFLEASGLVFSAVMEDDEAIVITGPRQAATYSGYASKFKFQGLCGDKFPTFPAAAAAASSAGEGGGGPTLTPSEGAGGMGEGTGSPTEEVKEDGGSGSGEAG